MYRKALEMGVCYHNGPVLGNMEGTLLYSFPKAFERRMSFFLLSEELLLRNSRDMSKKAVETGNSLRRGPCSLLFFESRLC